MKVRVFERRIVRGSVVLLLVGGAALAFQQWGSADRDPAPSIQSFPTLPSGALVEIDPDWVLIADYDFLSEDWTVEERGVGGAVNQRRIEGGNPGAFRQSTHAHGLRSTLPPDFVNVLNDHRLIAASYDPGDPANGGPIAEITIAFDAAELQGSTDTQVLAGALLLFQDGRPFGPNLFGFGFEHRFPGLWIPHSRHCLQPSLFQDVTSSPPDFSAQGAPIQFGYAINGSHPDDDITMGVDNFRVVVHRGAPGECGEGPLDLQITKRQLERGAERLIRYILDVTNRGRFAENFKVLEIVPTYTTFIPEESSPGWRCRPDVEERSECTILLFDLEERETQSIRFTVKADGALPREFEIFNEAEVERGPRAARLVGKTCGFCEQVLLGPTDLCETKFTLGGESPAPLRVQEHAEEINLAAPDPVVAFRLRDRILGLTPGGRRTIELYYDHAPSLLAAALQQPGYFGTMRQAAQRWQPLFRALIAGQGDSAVLTAQHVDDFRDFFELLRPTASAALVSAIDTELPKLDLDSWEGLTIGEALASLDQLVTFDCQPTSTQLCLNQGRFRVEVDWSDFEGATGAGQAQGLTPDTGTFWFFGPENIELIVKVLDARGVNGHFWVFYGALSNVEYTINVTDSETGELRTYRNPSGEFGSFGDVNAFAAAAWSPRTPDAATVAGGVDRAVGRSRLDRSPGPLMTTLPASPGGGVACEDTDTALCLSAERFLVEVEWQDFEGNSGVGNSVLLTDDTGAFWFFDPDNVELAIKVLDARGVNGNIWVFYGALSNVEYTITVTDTDTETGDRKIYSNPSGTFASVGDTAAFPGG